MRIMWRRMLAALLAVMLLGNLVAQAAAAPGGDKVTRKPLENVITVTLEDTETGSLTTGTIFEVQGSDLTEAQFAKALDSKHKLKEFKKEKLKDKREYGDIGILWVETAFDVGNFMLSLAEYNANPTFWNGFWLVFDGASVVLPGIPAVSSFRRGASYAKSFIEGSPRLKTALQWGVMKYGRLTGHLPYGYQAHHIFEKRFAADLGTTEYSMLAIGLDTATHQTFTTKMAGKIPTGGGPWDPAYIIQQHQEAYYELAQYYGDNLWQFLYEFSLTGQHTAIDTTLIRPWP